MNRTCTVLQQGLTVGDREDRGEPFVHRASIARFFPSRCSQVNAGSATILHGPSRWTYGVNTVQHGSPRSGSPSRSSEVHHGGFWHVKNHRKDPRFIQVHQASSRSITVALRFNSRYSPVHPCPWTGVNRGVPGAQWDWGIRFNCFQEINVAHIGPIWALHRTYVWWATWLK